MHKFILGCFLALSLTLIGVFAQNPAVVWPNGTYRGDWKMVNVSSSGNLTGFYFTPTGTLSMEIELELTDQEKKTVRPGGPFLPSYNISGDLILRNSGPLSAADALSGDLIGLFFPNISTVLGVLVPRRNSLNYTGFTGGAASASNPNPTPEETAAGGRRLGPNGNATSSAPHRKTVPWDDDEHRQRLREAALSMAHEGATEEDFDRYLQFSDASKFGRNCDVMVRIKLKPRAKDYSRTEWDKGTVEIEEGTIYSTNCPLLLSFNGTEVDVDLYIQKATSYGLMFSLASFMQSEAMTEHAVLVRASMLTIGAQAVMDAYLTILHLTASVVIEKLFNVLASAAFLQFILFAIFEMRLMLTIMKARQGSTRNERVDLASLSCRFYVALLTGVFGMVYLQRHFKLVSFVFFSFWVPQIVHSARMNLRPPWTTQYIRTMSITRLALPLYLFGCPSNILQIEPDYVYCSLLCLWMFAQAYLLETQIKYGAQYFIPEQFLPEKYSYFRAIPKEILARYQSRKLLPLSQEARDAAQQDPDLEKGALPLLPKGTPPSDAAPLESSAASDEPGVPSVVVRIDPMTESAPSSEASGAGGPSDKELEKEAAKRQGRTDRERDAEEGRATTSATALGNRGTSPRQRAAAAALERASMGSAASGSGAEGPLARAPSERSASTSPASSPPLPPSSSAATFLPLPPPAPLRVSGPAPPSPGSPPTFPPPLQPLPHSHGEDDEGEHTCSICLEPLDLPANINNNRMQRMRFALTTCNHLFHADCLFRALESKLECPLCRTAQPQP